MDKKAVVAEMVEELVKSESYSILAFQRRWPCHPGTFGDLRTKAEDIARSEHGIEFRPGPAGTGTRVRANYQETFNRSKRQRRAGLKKLDRSVVRAEVASRVAPEEVREAIGKSAELQKLQLTAAKIRSSKRLSAVADPNKEAIEQSTGIQKFHVTADKVRSRKQLSPC